MKFILMIEENGYQVRYWDQITDQIGESIATNWDKHRLYSTLNSKGFNISKNTLSKAMKEIEEEKKSFVVLTSENKDTVSLDTFMNDLFDIDEGI